MSVEDGEFGRSSGLVDDTDQELDSGTGYESASDGVLSLRRKMSSDGEDDQKKGRKKRKKDKDREKQNGDSEKDKIGKTKMDVSEKYKERDGFLEDGWEKNKLFTTFFIEPTDPTTNIHVMELARTLHNIKITNYTELKTAGKNRYRITFANPKHAENLINSKILKETFKYKIYVPAMFKETIGVVRDIPPSIPEQEILEKLESERINIKKVERIQKMEKGKLVPTYSVKIYAEGDKLPREVIIFGIPKIVEVYLFPVKFCYKCLRYGHRVKACKSGQQRCYICANGDHEGKDCKSLDLRCFHCGGSHKAFDVNCKERIRQENINKSMAYNKLTFNEAEKRYPRKSQTEIRLQSNEEFPPITDKSDEAIPQETNWNPKAQQDTNPNSKPNVQESQTQTYTNNKNKSNTQEITEEKYITKVELEQIVNSLKMEMIKQLNMNKMITKIKQIKDKIDKTISNKKDNKQTNNSDEILKQISDQLQEIVNPTFLKPNENPLITQPNNSEWTQSGT